MNKNQLKILIICAVACICIVGLAIGIIVTQESGKEPSIQATTPSTQATTPSTEATQPSTEATQPTTEATQPTTEATEPTQKPTEPVTQYINPLSGETMDAPYTSRPVAVVINNIKSALPHHGVKTAKILCEIVAEGGVTRCLAVYDDISKAGAIGSIRSGRTYLLSLAMNYDAIFVSAGTSIFFDEMNREVKWEHLNGLRHHYFYRSQDRLNQGYAREHTMFTSGEGLVKAIEKYKLTGTSENLSYGWEFSDAPNQGTQTANQITVHFYKNGKATNLTYHPDTKLYTATQHNQSYIDANDNTEMAFRNVLMIFAKTEKIPGRSNVRAELTGTGTGYFAVDGKVVPIRWSRESDYDPFVYTLEDGTPVVFGVGTTYMAVMPTGSNVSFR